MDICICCFLCCPDEYYEPTNNDQIDNTKTFNSYNQGNEKKSLNNFVAVNPTSLPSYDRIKRF